MLNIYAFSDEHAFKMSFNLPVYAERPTFVRSRLSAFFNCDVSDVILYENKKLDSSATLTPLIYISAIPVVFSITSPYIFFF